MDGVLFHGNKLLPGVRDFVNWLKDERKKFVLDGVGDIVGSKRYDQSTFYIFG